MLVLFRTHVRFWLRDTPFFCVLAYDARYSAFHFIRRDGRERSWMFSKRHFKHTHTAGCVYPGNICHRGLRGVYTTIYQQRTMQNQLSRSIDIIVTLFFISMGYQSFFILSI